MKKPFRNKTLNPDYRNRDSKTVLDLSVKNGFRKSQVILTEVGPNENLKFVLNSNLELEFKNCF
jgi:hypothetical protein